MIITGEATSEGGQGGLAGELAFGLNLKHEVQPVVPSAGRNLLTCGLAGVTLKLSSLICFLAVTRF